MSQTPADVVAESDGSGGCVKVSLHWSYKNKKVKN